MSDIAVVGGDKLGIATAEQLNGLAFPHVRFTSQQLVFHEDTPIEEWNSVGVVLKGLEKNVNWWLGDWLRFGDRKYGEMYSQAVEETDYTYSALANMKYVAERYDGHDESSSRDENLSWTHHRYAASLPPDERREVLEKARDEKLSSDELRSEVIERKQIIKQGTPTWTIDAAETGPDFLVADTVGYGAQVHPDGNIYMYDKAGRKWHIPDLDDFLRRAYALKAEAQRHYGTWPQK